MNGDRIIPDSEFATIQKDRKRELQYWASEVSKLQSNKSLKSGFVAANSHYAGFGPGTANMFLKMLSEQELTSTKPARRNAEFARLQVNARLLLSADYSSASVPSIDYVRYSQNRYDYRQRRQVVNDNGGDYYQGCKHEPIACA
jgi:hypothetical protein